jgi:hypothetical protein
MKPLGILITTVISLKEPKKNRELFSDLKRYIQAVENTGGELKTSGLHMFWESTDRSLITEFYFGTNSSLPNLVVTTKLLILRAIYYST